MIDLQIKKEWLPGLSEMILNKVKKDIENSLPCEVVKVHERNLVDVRPLIKKVASGQAFSRQIIPNIHSEIFGAGDLLISFPVKVGDRGWIIASDRDISLFLQNDAESEPPTARKHSFNDARFIPDIMKNFTISEDDIDALVIQNRDGTVKIALDQNEIRITNGTVHGVISSTHVDFTAPSGFFVNGAQITPSGDVVSSSGVSVNNHTHTQPNDSAGNTEYPTGEATPTE